MSAFSSQEAMESAGWTVNLSNFNSTDEVDVDAACRQKARWYGYYSDGTHGEISVHLRGRGVVNLEFANCWTGIIRVEINGELKESAGANLPSTKVSLDFRDGDLLRISEEDAIIVVNDIGFVCSAPAGRSMV